ncbi:MAG: hypothetical protein Q9217_001204 [Psora testacea]
MEAKVKASLGNEFYDACREGDLDAVIAVVSRSKRANPSYTPPLTSILYAATSKDRANVVKYCLYNGAEVTPDVMKILLINRAKDTYTLFLDSKAVDIDYYIPWFGDILSNVATSNDMEWTKLCLSRGANPNKNLVEEHKSVLAAVAEGASVEMAVLLIEHGAQVKGSGAIVMAAEEGKLDMVKLLLNKGADIDEIGIEHPTDPRFKEDMGGALHRAVEGGHERVVKFLIENGADVNLKDVMGRTPLALAQGKKNAAIVELLKERDAVE